MFKYVTLIKYRLKILINLHIITLTKSKEAGNNPNVEKVFKTKVDF